MKTHNPYEHKKQDKLVRDRIPEIIKENGDVAVVKVIRDDNEFYKRLLEKLQEEISEFIETPNVEEAADVFEVYKTILEFKKIDFDEVIDKKIKKRFLKGGFDKRIVLRTVTHL